MDGVDAESLNNPKNMQQYFYEIFGDRDWDSFNLDQHHILKRTIGFSLFGNPMDDTYIDTTDTNTGYTKKQNEQINKIYELIKQNHYDEDPNIIILRIIFVVCQTIKTKKKPIATFQTPVFVIKKCFPNSQDTCDDLNNCCKIFIDESGRVYKSWKKYLEDNKLPKCNMYCPRNGKYSGEINENAITYFDDGSSDGEVNVILEIHKSPACKIGHKFLEGTDTVGTVVSVGSTIALAACIIPGIVVAPAVIATAAFSSAVVGLYGAGRSIGHLVDRGIHDQSISLKDSEARGCWLGTTVSLLGVGSSAATGLLTKAVSNGTKIGQGIKVAFNGLNAATVVGSATCIINSGYSMFEKKQNKENITKLEIFQLSTCILFFFKSTIGFKSATTIISEVQTSTIERYADTLRSNRHRKIFQKAQLETRRIHGKNAGNAEIISGIRNINDPDNFFAGLVRMNKDFNKSGSRFTITADGKVQINSAYIVDPTELVSLTRSDRVDQLSNLPPPQPTIVIKDTFDTNKVAIKNWFVEFVDTHKGNISSIALTFIGEIVKNGADIQTFALLLAKFSEDIKQYFLKIFVQFFISVKDVITEKFKELFPFVSLSTGVMQFLIKIVTEISDSLNIPLADYLKMCFNLDGSIENNFICMIIDKMFSWITTKIVTLHNNITEQPFITGNKIRKDCAICNGYYFETVKK